MEYLTDHEGRPIILECNVKTCDFGPARADTDFTDIFGGEGCDFAYCLECGHIYFGVVTEQ